MEDAPKRPTAEAGQCLLLLPPGCEPPAELLGGLRKRGVSVRQVSDAPAAMVALARQRYLSMVIIEPDCLPQTGELAAAARRYHAATTIWRYAADDEPRLMRWPSPAPLPAGEGLGESGDSASSPSARQTSSAEPAPPAPAYEHAETTEPPAPEPQAQPKSPEIEISLSDEELAMLLADDDPPI